MTSLSAWRRSAIAAKALSSASRSISYLFICTSSKLEFEKEARPRKKGEAGLAKVSVEFSGGMPAEPTAARSVADMKTPRILSLMCLHELRRPHASDDSLNAPPMILALITLRGPRVLTGAKSIRASGLRASAAAYSIH